MKKAAKGANRGQKKEKIVEKWTKKAKFQKRVFPLNRGLFDQKSKKPEKSRIFSFKSPAHVTFWALFFEFFQFFKFVKKRSIHPGLLGTKMSKWVKTTKTQKNHFLSKLHLGRFGVQYVEFGFWSKWPFLFYCSTFLHLFYETRKFRFSKKSKKSSFFDRLFPVKKHQKRKKRGSKRPKKHEKTWNYRQNPQVCQSKISSKMTEIQSCSKKAEKHHFSMENH